MHGDDALKAQIESDVYEHRSTKAEIVEYYQEAYPGKGKGGRGLAWKQALVADVLREKGITPEGTDPKEYKKQVSSANRRFDPSRLSSPEPKNKAEYKALGKKLPPQPPKDINYTVRVTGEIRISNWCRPVDFTVTVGSGSDFSLQGANAQAFTENPNVYDLVEAYWQGDDPGYAGWCSGPTFTIES